MLQNHSCIFETNKREKYKVKNHSCISMKKVEKKTILTTRVRRQDLVQSHQRKPGIIVRQVLA
jgi:hypothetical protein